MPVRSVRMPHLFGPQGEAALAQVVRRSPLLAFDFDGTLAPIVARPGLARIPLSVASRLRRLRELFLLAVVTGRSVDDVRARLDFDPHFVIGNHGAEVDTGHGAVAPSGGLEAVRERLQRWSGELERAGVTVEDKGLSLALHYRLSRDPEAARALIAELLPPDHGDVRIFGGKMVHNVVPADAPDKARALFDVVAQCGASCAIFAGDDINDEPVFAAAPDDWLTVRVGRDAPNSRAAYFLDSTSEMAPFLDRLLRLGERDSGAAVSA